MTIRKATGIPLLAALSLTVGPLHGGELEPPATNGGPTEYETYTLEDLFQRLSQGTPGVKSSFTEPAAGPTEGTLHTVNDIMGVAPAPDDVDGASPSDVLGGKKYWGLRSGQWGMQTGTATAGNDVIGGEGSRVIPIPDGLYSGGRTATATDSNLVAANIRKGVTIFGVTGTLVEACMIPNAFAFTDRNDVEPGTVVTSNKVTITGNGCPAYVELTSGDTSCQVSINGGSFGNFGGTVNAGGTVQLQVAAPSTELSTVSCAVNISGVADTDTPWQVTTWGSPLPGAATQIAPNGNITDTTPTFIWNAEATATWYYLWINDSSGELFKKWYTAGDVGCDGGTGTCQIDSEPTLASGEHTWWVQTWNDTGYGPWSAGMTFTVE